MMRKIAIAALIALAVGPAFAQTPPAGTPTRIRGTVDKLDGQNLTVKSRDGQMLTIELAANVAVITLVKKSIADIRRLRRLDRGQGHRRQDTCDRSPHLPGGRARHR
jgi:hypothetical protein